MRCDDSEVDYKYQKNVLDHVNVSKPYIDRGSDEGVVPDVFVYLFVDVRKRAFEPHSQFDERRTATHVPPLAP